MVLLKSIWFQDGEVLVFNSVGWICIHDPTDVLSEIRDGIMNLSQLIIGSNSLIQAAVPDILATDESFNKENMKQLQGNAELCIELLQGCPGNFHLM